MARNRHYSHPAPSGILGTYPNDPEVIGVFPELSSTVIPHAQEVRLRRGDDLDLDFQIQDDQDPPDYVLTDGSVVRFAAKQGFGQTEREGLTVGNEGALVLKRSSDPDEIELRGGGRGTVHIRRSDTLELPLSPAVWDLEVTKPKGEHELPPGAEVQLQAGVSLVTARGFQWSSEIMSGDIFEAQGHRVLVVKRVSAIHLKVDWTDWENAVVPASAPGCEAEFCVSRGMTKTVASGPFNVEGDVVI